MIQKTVMSTTFIICNEASYTRLYRVQNRKKQICSQVCFTVGEERHPLVLYKKSCLVVNVRITCLIRVLDESLLVQILVYLYEYTTELLIELKNDVFLVEFSANSKVLKAD